MSVSAATISTRIDNILQGMGLPVEKRDVDGNQVLDPTEAVRFAVKDRSILVRFDQSQDSILLSTGVNEDDEKLRQMLKNLARDTMKNFDYKRFGKKLRPKSERVDIAQRQNQDLSDISEEQQMHTQLEQPVAESFGAMTGTVKTSYQPLDNVKIIVKHRKPVNEESRGARSRNIHSIYIQRGEEKFKMTENNLRAARAMARHVNMGGEVFDSVGTAITEMAQEERKLREFVRYVRNRKLMNEDNEHYVTLATESVNSIRNTFDKLSGVRSYANAVDTLHDMASVEILEDDVDLENKFTEKHLDDRVTNAVDSIRRSISRQRAYESAIQKAIEEENFEEFRNFLRETDVADFENPRAKLGYEISQLSNAAQNPLLKTHLQGISNRLSSGQTLNDSDYRTVKSCLLSAREAKVQVAPVTESIELRYTKFLEQFDIDP